MRIWQLGFAAVCASVLASSPAKKGQVYSTNAMCLKNNCVNPIFPALRLAGSVVMEEQEAHGWACVDNWKSTRQASSFCSRTMDYPFSVPTGGTVQDHLVDADHKAMLAFASHLSGIGLDAWDHNEPWAPDAHPCVQSVWRLACYTYFPKCSAINAAQYMRPCRSACEDYIKACSIECCDEGVKCVFSHAEVMDDGDTVKTKGYVNHVGPSVLCTGAAPRSSARCHKPSWFLMAFLLTVVFLFQGCDHWGGYMIPNDISVPQRRKALWRMQSDYTIETQVVQTKNGVRALNSCMTPGIGVADVCSGRGHCATWNPDDVAHPMWICKCESPWAGMECNIKRYSQSTAWILSVFFGYLGVDLMYLGFPVRGFVKLISLGGFGVWWLMDIVYIGSGPIYAKEFRVVHDLPRWVFALSTIVVFLVRARSAQRASRGRLNPMSSSRPWIGDHRTRLWFFRCDRRALLMSSVGEGAGGQSYIWKGGLRRNFWVASQNIVGEIGGALQSFVILYVHDLPSP